MATLITGATGRAAYARALEAVLLGGFARSPRGLKTIDLGHTTIELDSPYNALPIGVGRNLSRRVAAAETVQLIGHFSDPQLLFDASPNFKRYAEDDGSFYGAYGTRIGAQLHAAYVKLSQDPDTRQAVITLWRPDLDNEDGHRDYPCTLALAFSRDRRGFLELDVTMRSNDAWRGLPYDVHQFTQVQLTLARALGWEPGRYRHHAHSLHIYLDDYDDARRVASVATPKFVEELPTGFGTLVGDLETAIVTARRIAYDEPPFDTPMNLTESEAWYWHVLRGHQPELSRDPAQ